jgi:quercetin dioxygenase-like cupin family protein
MRGAIAIALAALAGCGGASGGADGKAAAPSGKADATKPAPRPAAKEADEAEKVAAIEHIVNGATPAVQACWARAASVDYKISGTATVKVVFGAGGTPSEAVAGGTAVYTDALFAACLADVFRQAKWPPVFAAGETVQLPLHFQQVDSQNLIHLADVKPVAVDGGLEAQVLLDVRNTGNPAASLVLVRVPPGGLIPLAASDKDEIWFVEADDAKARAGINGVLFGPQGEAKGAKIGGGAAWIPAGTPRGFRSKLSQTETLVLMLRLPGGEEAGFRAGKLPAAPPSRQQKPVVPKVIGLEDAPVYGKPPELHTIAFDESTTGSKAASLGKLEAPAAAVVPPHVHAGETEILLVREGGGTMTIAGVAMPVTAGDAIQIPAGVQHSFTAGEAGVNALQFYTPAGPEHRFKSLQRWR